VLSAYICADGTIFMEPLLLHIMPNCILICRLISKFGHLDDYSLVVFYCIVVFIRKSIECGLSNNDGFFIRYSTTIKYCQWVGTTQFPGNFVSDNIRQNVTQSSNLELSRVERVDQ
jgi:hypothetical protein